MLALIRSQFVRIEGAEDICSNTFDALPWRECSPHDIGHDVTAAIGQPHHGLHQRGINQGAIAGDAHKPFARIFGKSRLETGDHVVQLPAKNRYSKTIREYKSSSRKRSSTCAISGLPRNGASILPGNRVELMRAWMRIRYVIR